MSKAISLLLLRAALAATLATPALAQGNNPVAYTQYPPSMDNGSEAAPQTLNSLPPGAATGFRDRPGADIETTRFGQATNAASAAEAPEAAE